MNAYLSNQLTALYGVLFGVRAYASGAILMVAIICSANGDENDRYSQILAVSSDINATDWHEFASEFGKATELQHLKG